MILGTTLHRPIRQVSIISAMVIALLSTSGKACGSSISEQIDEYLMHQVRDAGVVGLAAAVVRDGDVVYEGAFGVRKLGEGENLTTHHVLHLASVSKTFVAFAIMQLVEQNKLQLDDPVTKWLPYFCIQDPETYSPSRYRIYRQITIRQLLNHTSGIPDVHDYRWDHPQYDARATERMIRAMRSEHLLFAPGRGFAYSNKAFDTLAAVISQASGMSFEAYMQRSIFSPIGMLHSTFSYPEVDPALRSSGHVGIPARTSAVYPYTRQHAGSSTLNSSVEDMTHWMLVNLQRGEFHGARILGAGSFDVMWAPTTGTPLEEGRVKIGLSWFLGQWIGHRTVYHFGRDTGFGSAVMLLPDDGIGIVIASNYDGLDRQAVTCGILGIIISGGNSETADLCTKERFPR